MNKKEVKKRPVNQCGKDMAFYWMTDNNEVYISGQGISAFNDFLDLNDKPSNGMMPRFGPFKAEIGDEWVYYAKDEIKLLEMAGNDYFELFLVWAELPDMVENILINNYKEIKRQKAILQDKVNAKRSKIWQ